MALIPLISSEIAGPLGAIHLPRLWSKLLLSASGQLEAGYDECGGGFDQMVLDGLNVDRDVAVNFVKSNKPTYPQLEQWVLEQHPVQRDRCFERGDPRLQPRRRHAQGNPRRRGH